MSDRLADAAQQLGNKRTSLQTTATFLVFEPGLYAIIFKASASAPSDIGLRLPCARLEPIPTPGGGVATVTTLPNTGWLSTETASAHILVAGGRAGAMLTVFRPSDAAAMPTVEFRAVFKLHDLQGVQHRAPEAPRPVSAFPVAASLHVDGVGALTARAEDWVCVRNSIQPISGFSLAAEGLQPGDLRYRGVMGLDWLTPWFNAGEFCGSRDLGLPLFGFTLELSPAATARVQVEYWGIFAGQHVVGPKREGENCEMEGQPLTSFRIVVSARQDTPKPVRKPKVPAAAAKPVRRVR